jgi:hypothetical protein
MMKIWFPNKVKTRAHAGNNLGWNQWRVDFRKLVRSQSLFHFLTKRGEIVGFDVEFAACWLSIWGKNWKS